MIHSSKEGKRGQRRESGLPLRDNLKFQELLVDDGSLGNYMMGNMTRSNAGLITLIV